MLVWSLLGSSWFKLCGASPAASIPRVITGLPQTKSVLKVTTVQLIKNNTYMKGVKKLVIGKKNTVMHLVDLYLVKSSTNFCFLFVFVIHVQYTWYTCTGTVVVVHTLRAQQQFQECFLRTCTCTCGTLQSRAILHVRVLVFLS